MFVFVGLDTGEPTVVGTPDDIVPSGSQDDHEEAARANDAHANDAHADDAVQVAARSLTSVKANGSLAARVSVFDEAPSDGSADNEDPHNEEPHNEDLRDGSHDEAEGLADDAAAGKRSGWWPRLRNGLLITAAVAVIGVLVFGLLAWRAFNKLDRVDVGGALSDRGGRHGVNYLIAGLDSREGIDPDNPNEAVIGSLDGPSRTDTLVVLHVGPQGAAMLPLPRDLFVPIAGTTASDRINTAVQGGVPRLLRTVQQSLGVPVDHYLEVDFAGFLHLVDAVGGVPIDFDSPAYDRSSGLDIPTAGTHVLDRDQALAFVRSRHYTRVVNGKPVEDPTADLGRIERQQRFLRAVMSEVGGARNPVTLLRLANGLSNGLKIDNEMSFRDMIALARRLRGVEPETLQLPVRPTTRPNGAAVLLLNEASSQTVFERVRQ